MISQLELDKLKVRLQELIVEDLDAALALLKDELPQSSSRLADVLNIEGKYKSVKQDKIRDVDSSENLRVATNKVRQDLIDLTMMLEVSDFDPNKKNVPFTSQNNKWLLLIASIVLLLIAAYFFIIKSDATTVTVDTPEAVMSSAVYSVPTSVPEDRDGHLLYKIPQEMQLGEWAECTIRLSYDSAIITKNIDLQGAVMKSLESVTEIMEVELRDASFEDEPNFSIKTLNRNQQRIRENNFTEWIFSVKPLKVGTFPLALKVSIMEDGVPYEIVFKETINVTTSAPIASIANPEFMNAGYVIKSYTESSSSSCAGNLSQFAFVDMSFSVSFNFNSINHIPSQNFNAYIDSMIAFSQLHPDITIHLTGHTDNIGSEEYNIILGKKRAEKIKRLIIKKGIEPSVKFEIDSKGEGWPVAPNDSPKGRRKNRRVNIDIAKSS